MFVFAVVFPVNMMLTHLDWLSLGVIALSKCLNITIHDHWSKFCNNRTNLALLLMAVWIFPVLAMIPMYLEVRKIMRKLSPITQLTKRVCFIS